MGQNQWDLRLRVVRSHTVRSSKKGSAFKRFLSTVRFLRFMNSAFAMTAKELLILQHSLPTISLLLHLKMFFFFAPSRMSGPFEKKNCALSLLNRAIFNRRSLTSQQPTVNQWVGLSENVVKVQLRFVEMRSVVLLTSPLGLTGFWGSGSEVCVWSKINYSNYNIHI